MRILCIILCIFLTSCGSKRAVYQLENGVTCKHRWNDGSYHECSDGASYRDAVNVKVRYE